MLRSAALALLVALVPLASAGPVGAATHAAAARHPASAGRDVVLRDGLRLRDVRVGTGAPAKAGERVTVTYAGRLRDGTVFDASDRHGGEGFAFTLGAGEVIKGWDEGVAGMRVGGERTLTIPPELGYGAAGAGGAIPPNATLIFDVKLLGVGR